MGSDFYTTTIFAEDGISSENLFDPLESINLIKDTLEPGDSTKGQFFFNISKVESYELVYNLAMSSAATEITWEFTADEASNE